MNEIQLAEKLLTAELNKRTLKPEYSDSEMSSVIHSAIKKSIAEKCTLRIDDSGELVPMQKDDPTLLIFKDNRRQSVDDLIRHFDKYFIDPAEAQRQAQPEPDADMKDISPALRHMRQKREWII